MEELKRLIKEDKEVIGELDTHIKELGVLLSEFKGILPLFGRFFDEQAEFVKMMRAYIEKGREEPHG
jgi:hypothetical protein